MRPEELESLLHRARLGEPPADLRSRMLLAARERGRTRPAWRQWLPELAAAALIFLSLGLLSRPEILQPRAASEISSRALEGETGGRILEAWRTGFDDEPGLSAYLESYLSFLDRASERDDTPSLPLDIGEISRRPST